MLFYLKVSSLIFILSVLTKIAITVPIFENIDRILYKKLVSFFVLQKRHVLEENNEIDARVSSLEIDDFDLEDEEEEEDEDDEDFEEKKRIAEMLDKAKQSSKDDRRDR